MEISRRAVLRTAAVAAGSAAIGSGPLFGSLAEAAVKGRHRTTLRVRYAPSGDTGYRKIVEIAGEPHQVREDLGAVAAAGREEVRRGLVSFVQLSDVHVVDHQSPGRVEWCDRYDDPNDLDAIAGLFSSAWRPQELLSAQVADAMVRAVNEVGRGPVTSLPFAFAIQTGDNSDNCQHNEVRWNIDVLDGGRVHPDSGSTARYEGVMESDPLYYDRHYWHPHGAPLGRQADLYRTAYGFPVVPGLLDAARRPFDAVGLDCPWYTCFGNHDGLVQGNFPHTMQLSTIATGSLKVISPPPGTSQSDVVDAATSGDLLGMLGTLTVSPYVKLVSQDPQRKSVTRGDVVEEHFATTGLPVGHGFTEANRATGTAYYWFDHGPFRMVVMDTVNPNGYYDGSLDEPQFLWLQETVAGAAGKAVLVFSHHTSGTMDNVFVATGGDLSPRVQGAAVTSYLLSQPRVVAWVNGHSHRNEVRAHVRPDGGGFWEINTASHIDYPQQARIIEVADNKDGTWSIFTTILDHAGRASYGGDLSSTVALASLARELSANDPQANLALQSGEGEDRNVELLVARPGDVA